MGLELPNVMCMLSLHVIDTLSDVLVDTIILMYLYIKDNKTYTFILYTFLYPYVILSTVYICLLKHSSHRKLRM